MKQMVHYVESLVIFKFERMKKMRKRTLVIMLLALVGVSMGFLYTNDLFKNSLNAASAPNFVLNKGSKVVLGKYNNKEIVWDIGNNTSDYVLMSSKPIEDNAVILNNSLPTITSPAVIGDRENSNLDYGGGNTFSYCPMTPLKNKINNISLTSNESSIMSRVPFLPSVDEIKTGGSLGLTFHDRAYTTSTVYWLDGYITGVQNGNASYLNYYFTATQMASATPSNMSVVDFDTRATIPNSDGLLWRDCKNASIPFGNTGGLRPFATVDQTKVMFAANIS